MHVEPLFEHWLNDNCPLSGFQIKPLAGDASFRRYYRVQNASGSVIAMDASAEKKSCIPFVAIGNALRNMGLSTPEILVSDVNQGYLLLTDFGDRLYLNEMHSGNAEALYTTALQALTVMSRCREVDGWALSSFTADFMRHELNLFREWFLEKYLNLRLSEKDNHMLNACFDFLADTAAAQPSVFMHRDYHSANLMVLPRDGVGILDFQDAFIGPVTYDLVSLLRDCYVSLPVSLVEKLVRFYWEQLALPSVSLAQFSRWFDLMGVQRHLKALLTFSRKHCRDGNSNYLRHVPRTLNYVLSVSENYPELHELKQFLERQEIAEKCAE